MRSSYFFLTIFPQDELTFDRWETKFTQFCNRMNIQWMTGQWENCPTTGRLHAHVYMYVKRRLRYNQILNAFKRFFGYDLGYLAARDKTHQDAKKYVNKEETRVPGTTPFSWGTEPEQPRPGRRTDLAWAAEVVRNDLSLSRIIHERPDIYVRSHAGLRSLLQLLQQEHVEQAAAERVRTDIVKIAFTGEGGTGKSYMARSISALLYNELGWRTYRPQVQNGGVYFDNYTDQEILIVDEFYSNFPYLTWCNMTDSSYNPMPMRYGVCNPQWKVIIFTSNASYPEQWYARQQVENPATRRAVARRFWHRRFENPLGVQLTDPTRQEMMNILQYACNAFNIDFDSFFGFIEEQPPQLDISSDEAVTPVTLFSEHDFEAVDQAELDLVDLTQPDWDANQESSTI